MSATEVVEHALSNPFSVSVAKAPHGGEDAPPITSPRLIAVCDGLGGSGSVKYQTKEGERTGAYVAARIVSHVIGQHGFNTAEDAASLFLAIQERLRGYDKAAGTPRSGVKSSNLRPLPTTLAAAAPTLHPHDVTRVYVASAGDSRVYRLDSVNGLSQLTVDDLQDPVDAFDAVYTGGKMSNCISLERDWWLTVSRFDFVGSGFFLIACSDGCFDYSLSPMHFEELLVQSLVRSADLDEWKERLTAYFKAYSQDDATLAAVFIGTETEFERIRARFIGRANYVTDSLLHPLGPSQVGLRNSDWHEQLRSVWETYSPGYYAWSPVAFTSVREDDSLALLATIQHGMSADHQVPAEQDQKATE